MGIFDLAVDVVTNPKYSRWVGALLLSGEAVLCGLIILRIPYTEIDWTTYMQQVELFLKGERDYSKIEGSTGPIVYPALHVYIYSTLNYLTDNGTSIQKAQIIFATLYLLTLSIVFSCYRKVGAPPYLLIPLVLSKRLHSIFLLRLFNDTWAVFGFWLAVWFLQRRMWLPGAMAWCAGLGVKMTLLLSAPAVGAIVIQGAGRKDGLIIAAFVAQFQLAIALPFLLMGDVRAYISRSFQFNRQFLYQWTVNWKMLNEEFFLSKKLTWFLLGYHVSTVGFFLNDRWLAPSSTNIAHFVRQYIGQVPRGREQEISKKVTPMFVMESMLGSTVLGLLCARSLHYQFYVYLGWATPFLLWRSGVRPGAIFFLWGIQEAAWLIYPSSTTSSNVVVACLAVQSLAIWFATGVDPEGIVSEGDKPEEELKE